MNANAFNTDWTPERIDILVQLRNDKWKRGAIADEINRRTGASFTRSAVCGKLDRIFPAAKPIKTAEERAETIRARNERSKLKKRAERAAERAAQGSAPKPNRVKTVSAPPPLAIVEVNPSDFPDARVHGVGKLEPHHCRFECTPDAEYDPAHPVFCGLPILANSKFSWCSGHHATLTQKPLKTWGAKAA